MIDCHISTPKEGTAASAHDDDIDDLDCITA